MNKGTGIMLAGCIFSAVAIGILYIATIHS